MVLLSVPYFELDTNVAFLRIKQWVFRTQPAAVSNVWIVAFFIHVFTSILALIAGFTQFNKPMLNNRIHKAYGEVYIAVILVFSGPSGLIMGFFANGGWLSVLAFTMLSILWIFFTFRAFTAVKARNFELHAKYMYRSYALTLSAVTLRLWKFVIANYIYEMPPMDLYRLVGWLGWVPNLLIAEYLIYRGKHLNLLKKRLHENKPNY
ncbi:DUF2306 domain-containing protein [Paracrocinitomix mangrovi]|uniref:DUF2306 domain-containing protein n=1 Tax=Paracrocinitomix mangrovi TaxID=2862509 RepID=UPI001C8E6DB2|nr:DUF2306 domain-containing protein [Paracrocinitomix mangrovi]UKN01718.1 DUF2306 domain-containing protein [Paracrocinitomix mangrovi]